MSYRNMILIDAGLFCEGMYVQTGIYYLYSGAYVLLCKDVVLTKELIVKLRDMALTNGGIYVNEDSYEDVWNESVRKYTVEAKGYKRAYQRALHDYHQVLAETVILLGENALDHTVSIKKSDTISSIVVKNLNNTDSSLILNCINKIYETDNYLYTHCINVATLNGLIGKWLNLPETKIRKLIKIGLLHDLGKLSVPPAILNKQGKLTVEEFEIIKFHPIFSYENLKKSGETDEEVLRGVLQHHEKVNGRGYPDRVKSDKIALAARITAVSDVYDAMVSKRCYKEPSTPFDVLNLFSQNQFSDLDIQVVRAFLSNIIYLLIGTHVKLDNGEIGEIIFIRENDYANPVVKTEKRIITACHGFKFIDDYDDYNVG